MYLIPLIFSSHPYALTSIHTPVLNKNKIHLDVKSITKHRRRSKKEAKKNMTKQKTKNKGLKLMITVGFEPTPQSDQH
jgi:hypothetical protein